MEIDPKSLFKSKKAIPRPGFIDLMKVRAVDEFKNLVGNANKQSKKVKCFALFISSIAEAIQTTGMSPGDVFLASFEKIKESVQKVEGTDLDTILSNIGAPFEQILLFLSVCYHAPDEVSNPQMGILQNSETVDGIESQDVRRSRQRLPPPIRSI